MKRSAFIFLLGLCVSLVFLSAAWFTSISAPPQTRRHKVVVFVHGTIFHPPSLPTFIKAISTASRDNVSLVNAYKQEHRRRSYMKQQIVGQRGLHALSRVDKTSYEEKIVSAFVWHDRIASENRHDTYHLYSFGWNGRLNGLSRKRWGARFYTELKNEVTNLRERYAHDDIEVTIITHSHGGNVALNMVHAASRDDDVDNGLAIDNLVLLGVPVQPETSSCIHASLFKNIYNIYSSKDMVQVIDIVSTGELFSRRCFSSYEKELPSHVKEVRVCVEGVEPSHIELWFVGGGDISYKLFRRTFPLYPEPVVVCVPYIIKALQKREVVPAQVCANVHQRDGAWQCAVQPHV